MLAWTEDLQNLVKQRKYAVDHKLIGTSPKMNTALKFLSIQLSQKKSTATDVQYRLIRKWWPQIEVILPSKSGGQSATHRKWKQRYEEAKRDFCTPSLFA